MPMAAALGAFAGTFLHRRCFLRPPRNPTGKTLRTAAAAANRAASSAVSTTEFAPNTLDAKVSNGTDQLACPKVSNDTDQLACPICYHPLISTREETLTSSLATNMECVTCKKAYVNNGQYLDLTISGGSKEFDETMPPSTELFRTPLVSFLYERGWRQNFVLGGFPGPEKEFEMAKEYLKPTVGGTVIDASCGSGLFSRLFAKSGLFSLVVALDFSENMLQQCDEFIKKEDISKENLILVRADISRLPFVTASVDAVHAGAALHCWPSPSAAVAEISRVLRPGGVFVATTFILDGFYPAVPILSAARQVFTRATSQHLYMSEGELEDLCRACGLVGFTCVRNGSFVMLSATKPG
ncbi:putative methyltransferase, chloroplastic isoform X1 [Iris pallida]|uniref:Methyltransferase, chloroplastic isoform X1 n=1 Tax=Iris pallida TaxID=29817 RepID=A0AAX6DJF6_IRIPA|nr:putative methyltransferase, chloroplastic isoform X1 [Iris pallida]